MSLSESLEFVGSLIAIIVAIYGVVKFIDYRVGKVIVNPSFIKELSGSLRPYAVFDEKGTILVDRGAMNFIEAIEVRMDTSRNIPERILIHPKIHLDQAPILITLDTDMCTVKECRGKKFDWVYEIKYHGYNNRDQRRFSMEIIK